MGTSRVRMRFRNLLWKHQSLHTTYAKTVLRYKKIRTYPVDLNFELTTRCNSKCAYCPRSKLIRKGVRTIGDMDFALVRKIVAEFSTVKNRYTHIAPVGLGEPLLYPRFMDVIHLLRKYFPKASITIDTNAIALNEEVAKKIISSGLDTVIVSINSWGKENYKTLNGVDRFNLVVDNVKHFLLMKGKRSPRVAIQILDIDANREKIEEFRNFWAPFLNENDSIYVRPLNDFGGTIVVEHFVSKRFQKGKRFPCSSLFATTMIDKDGFIYPCCMGVAYGPDVDICLGNIRNVSIREVYDGEKIQKLRKLHKKNRYDQIYPCNICESWRGMNNSFFDLCGRWI